MASSSDEGEIIEGGVEDLKATALARPEGNGIDRRDRNRSRQSSPDHDSASRHSGSSRRSRSPRGAKRHHDDNDHHGRVRDGGARHVRPRFDDPRRDDYRRSRVRYDDLDRPDPHSSNSYDGRHDRTRARGRDRSRDRGKDRYHNRDYDPYSDRSSRPRSRSPRGFKRSERPGTARFVREGQSDSRELSSKTLSYDDGPRRQQEKSHLSRSSDMPDRGRKQDDGAKQSQGPTEENGQSNGAAKQPESVNEPEPDYEEPQQFDEDAEIERRRKRREEILAKSSSATPLLLHAVGVAAEKMTRGASPASTPTEVTPQKSAFDGETPKTPRSGTSRNYAMIVKM